MGTAGLSGCCQCGVSSWLLILTADSGDPGRSRVHFIMAVAGVAAVVSSGRDPS